MSKNTKSKSKTRELTTAANESSDNSTPDPKDAKELKTMDVMHKSNTNANTDLPLLGQPGGLDDPLRRGLSGAGVKWYLRYLAQGIPPPEARRKAAEHRTGTGPPPADGQQTQLDQRKRALDTANAMTQHSLEAKRIKSSSANANAIRVAVLAQAYPQVGLSAIELATLEEALVDEIAKGWTAKLVFDGIEYMPGMLLIDCSDNDTADWLQYIVSRLPNWQGAALQTLLGDAIPQIHAISVHLPKSAGQSVEKTLALIYAQNADIYTHLWQIQNVCDDHDSHSQSLAISIDDASHRTLTKRNGHQLNYRFGRVAVLDVLRDMKLVVGDAASYPDKISDNPDKYT